MTTKQQRERTADDMAAMVRRCINALVRRAADGDGRAVTVLHELTPACRMAEGAAVQGLMDSPTAASWATIGNLTGNTRQGAMARYSSCTPSRTAGGQPGHLR